MYQPYVIGIHAAHAYEKDERENIFFGNLI